MISKKLPIFLEIFTYIICEMSVKFSRVFVFKLRFIVALVSIFKAIGNEKISNITDNNLTRI